MKYAERDSHGKWVLIVDDSSIMRKMIRKTIESENHIIVGEAKSGDEAIALYAALKPDLVTMDVTMREVDGFAAAKAILSGDPNARIIFLLSNLDEEKYSRTAMAMGAKGYVNKHKSREILPLIEDA